jgi:excinuclease UvrABC ATPase subunit
MDIAATTGTRSPAVRRADSHDLIRVVGARENNLKDVSIEIPKRRLTVFTGVSGSGKSCRGSCRRWRGPMSTSSTG